MKKSNQIAIIGGGPSGLLALKSALEDGLEAILLEQSPSTGGQWSQYQGHSGVWDTLSTNSSKHVTVFSDLDHLPDIELYPTHRAVKSYLDRYRDHFGLNKYIELNTRVACVEKSASGGYDVTFSKSGENEQTIRFNKVIIATGRFNKPHIPKLSGLDRFKGKVSHAFDYRNSAELNGKTVLVIGTRISGAELAGDVSLNPSVTVISSCRKPKYVLTKMINGEPGDHFLFNRFRGLAAAAFPPEIGAQRLKEFVLNHCGNPADFGGLKPSENIFEAGITASDNYLDQVKCGRIIPKPHVSYFTEHSVVFEDGTLQDVDHVILATGYDLNVPFLSSEIQDIVNSGDQHLDIYKYTFHPHLPGLAFIGMYMQIGALFPSLELQARWVTACWSGHVAPPCAQEMHLWIEEFKKQKGRGMLMLQETSVLFALAVDVEPELDKYPDLAGSLLFGPLSPSQFRLQGHGKKADAKEIYLRNAPSNVNSVNDLDDQQIRQLRTVAKLLPSNVSLSRLVKQM